MKRTYILGVLALGLGLTACEDYTDHHFGEDYELWQPKEVVATTVALTDANYGDIAANADNIALALKADTDGTRLAELQSVAEKHYFRKGITPEEYLPAMLKQLVGQSQYYAMTAGSTITVTCNTSADSLASGDAYVAATTVAEGKYLLVPQGTDQALNTLPADKTYGYINPADVTRLSPTALTMNDEAKQYLYDIIKDGDHYLIKGPDGMYLYMAGTYNSFNITDDLAGDLDDPAQAQWDITKNNDGTYDIVNVSTGKTMLYGTAYNSAGAYLDKKGTDGYLSLCLYKAGKVDVIVDGPVEQTDVVFTLGDDGLWEAKGDYLNQALTTTNSTDAAVILAVYGWRIDYLSSLGELSYVWSATTSYGIKASAYKNSTNFPTDARVISPAMNLKKAREPRFAFEEAQKYSPTPVNDFLRVEVSTDGTTWTDVTAQLEQPRPDGSSWNFTAQALDLTPYIGQPTVYVAFRYISTDTNAATWEFKNVRCAEKSDF